MRFQSLTLAILLSTTALAARAEAPQTPCRADAGALCPKALAAMDREAVAICLVKQIDKVSPACRARLESQLPKAPRSN